MVETRRRLGFAIEASCVFLMLGILGCQQLDRDFIPGDEPVKIGMVNPLTGREVALPAVCEYAVH